ncbi:PHD and RING finger domain-containing protein 1 [Symbiodinium microadriaticum]|uniref:PHD and RING finger domain-containing protein 1 n=1 Tax=Symbiodinium microadriaticum TaxID=2951 RepID=A0A1Q9DNJ1_SYMMI|nr:PHD and RING finger domain-containing protein 1 [Symbiodinium microadriaticum]
MATQSALKKGWLHRPVTPRELLKAKQPRPISINDFPSIFQRAGFAPLTTGDSLFILQPALAFRESGASQSDGVADGDDAQVHQKSKSDAQITVIRSFHRHHVLARWPNGPVSTDVVCDPSRAMAEEQSNRRTGGWRCSVCDGGPSGKLGSLIRCDGCDKTFHMNCHDPPVTRPGLPNEKWYCSHCTEALAQHRALRLRPGDFAWARLKATSVLWPCVVLKLDFTKPDDPRPYWVNFFEGRKGAEQRGAWVSEEQVLQWSEGPWIPESASQRQTALRQAQAAGAGPFGTERSVRCSTPQTPRRKVAKVSSPASGGTCTSSTTLPHSSFHRTPSSRRPSQPNLMQEAQKIQALLQEAQQRQRRLEARLSTPSPYSPPNSV